MLPTADWVELACIGLLLLMTGFVFHALTVADSHFSIIAHEIEKMLVRLDDLEQKTKARPADG